MSTLTDENEYEPIPAVDEEALERAIDICLKHKSPADQRQMEQKLADDQQDWWDIETFASYSCQMDALNLPPWQQPPCWINPNEIENILAVGGKDDIGGTFAAATLLKRLLAAGLSQYEPEPLKALKAANGGSLAAFSGRTVG